MTELARIGGASIDALHLVFLAVAAAAIGALFWMRDQRRATEAALAARLELETREAERMAAELATAEAELRAQRERAEKAEKDVAGLAAVQGELEKKFSDMAQGVLERSQRQFLTLANETFQRHQTGAKGDLEKLMAPIGENFAEFKKRVDAIEKVRTEDRSALQEQVKAIGESLQRNTRATGKLVTALSAPRGGGSWGEESLRNVMELAGMSAHADFVEQSHDDTERGRMRPDVIVRMPGGREIVVDSKVSMEDFLKAADEADETARKTHLVAHARKIRDHVQRLARKEYWKDFEGRVDFVAMYVPGEQFYSAALDIDRDLFDYAARNKVIIVTPSTLIALAKAVAYGWRQEEAANNARAATELGKQLYERLQAMGGHIEKLGKSLNVSVDSFNKMSRSLESRVLPGARKFQDLQIAAPDKPIPRIETVEARATLPDRTGELDLDDEAA
ncbi:MAG: DNA recombination protein RmuC [Pseudomonadota bacterium]